MALSDDDFEDDDAPEDDDDVHTEDSEDMEFDSLRVRGVAVQGRASSSTQGSASSSTTNFLTQSRAGDRCVRSVPLQGHDGSSTKSFSAMFREDGDDESEDDDDESEDYDENEDSEDMEFDSPQDGGVAMQGRAGSGTKSFLAQLQEDLKANPLNQELHIAFLTALREAANLDRLRAARKEAAMLIALPEEQWLEWLQDEQQLASSDSDSAKLEQLFAQACELCPTARIWLCRCASVDSETQPSDEEVQRKRSLFEKAINVLCLHPSEGNEVWAAFRDFELGLLEALPDGQQRNQQVQRVRTLFMRQLALPLPGVERLQEAHATFEKDLEEPLQSKTALSKAAVLAQSASSTWSEKSPFEQRLEIAKRPCVMVGPGNEFENSSSPVEIAAEILALEEASGDHPRIVAAHMRVVALSPTEVAWWQRYADFHANEYQHKQAAAVLERAVRHCPYCGELWLRLHCEYEAAQSPFSVLKQVVDRCLLALRSHPEKGTSVTTTIRQELLLQHSDAGRRMGQRLPKGSEQDQVFADMRYTLERAVTLAAKAEADGALSNAALMHWLRLETYALRNYPGTVQVGTQLMDAWGAYYHGWNTYILAVRHVAPANSYATIRNLFEQAITQVQDYPEQTKTDYLQFERECGTHGSFKEARQKLQVLSPPVQPTMEEKGAGEHEIPNGTAAKPSPKRKQTEVQPPDKQEKKKRKFNVQEGDSGSNFPSKLASKKQLAGMLRTRINQKTARNDARVEQTSAATLDPLEIATVPAQLEKSDKQVDDEGNNAVSDEVCGSKPVADKNEDAPLLEKSDGKDAVATEKGPMEKVEKNAHQGSHFHQKNMQEGKLSEVPKPEDEGNKTVYVANLDWSTEEPDLHRLFGEVEGLQDVRIVRDFMKRSKGYAYIDFDSRAGVDEAVRKLHGHMLNKRALKVAPSRPTKPLFEEKTIFVKSIAEKATKDHVQEVFAAFGDIAEVRMPEGVGGQKHKGCAYVQFESADAVANALAKKEEIQVVGNKVIIAQSIPMKDHKHVTAPTRKDIPQRANQRQIINGKLDREDPVRLSQQHRTTVYVKNLAFSVTEDILNEHFSQCGNVVQVLLCRNGKGVSRGFGFVEFKHADDAQSALLLSDSELKGRQIVVSRSQRAITQKKVAEEHSKPAVDESGRADGKGVGKRGGKIDSKARPSQEAFGHKPGAKRRLDLGTPGERDAAAEQSGGTASAGPDGDNEPPAKNKVPFRANRLAKEDGGEAKSGNSDAQKSEQESPADCQTEKTTKNRPLSNADFRALILGGK